MEHGSLAVTFEQGVPPLVLKIDEGKTGSNLRDIAGAALVLAKASRSPQPGIVDFLTEWTQIEDTKEFAEKKKSDDRAAANIAASHQSQHSAHK